MYAEAIIKELCRRFMADATGEVAVLQPALGLQFREQFVLVITRTTDDRAVQDVTHQSPPRQRATQGYRVLGPAGLAADCVVKRGCEFGRWGNHPTLPKGASKLRANHPPVQPGSRLTSSAQAVIVDPHKISFPSGTMPGPVDSP